MGKGGRVKERDPCSVFCREPRGMLVKDAYKNKFLYYENNIKR